MKIVDRILGRKRGMKPPPDPFWSQFEDAYGQGDEVAGLLARMTANWTDPVWHELWSRLCHQGSVFTASAAALPHLVTFAATLAPADRSAPLSLAAAIAAGMPDNIVPECLRASYYDALSRAIPLSLESVGAPSKSRADFVALLQAYASFVSYTPFGQWLDAVAEGEVELECPQCDSFIWVHPVPSKPRVTATESDRSSVLLPPTSLPPPGAVELQQLAEAADFALISSAVSLMYGQASCPICGHRFVPAEERAVQDRGAA